MKKQYRRRQRDDSSDSENEGGHEEGEMAEPPSKLPRRQQAGHRSASPSNERERNYNSSRHATSERGIYEERTKPRREKEDNDDDRYHRRGEAEGGRSGGRSQGGIRNGHGGGGERSRDAGSRALSTRDREREIARDRDGRRGRDAGSSRYESSRSDRRDLEQPPRTRHHQQDGRDRVRDRDITRDRGGSDYPRRDERSAGGTGQRGSGGSRDRDPYPSSGGRRSGDATGRDAARRGEDPTGDDVGNGPDPASKKSKGIFSYIGGGGGGAGTAGPAGGSSNSNSNSPSRQAGNGDASGGTNGSGAQAVARAARPNSSALSSIIRSDRRTNNRLDREQFDGAQTRLRRLAPEGDEVKDNFRYSAGNHSIIVIACTFWWNVCASLVAAVRTSIRACCLCADAVRDSSLTDLLHCTSYCRNRTVSLGQRWNQS